MALTHEAQNDAELAKAKIASAENIDEDYKRNLLNLITIATTATNGITPEQKIQSMTESIRLLALSQVDFITSIQNTIIQTISMANAKQCQDCIAMKHAISVKQKEDREKLIAEWKAANGIHDTAIIGPCDPPEHEAPKSWMDVAKEVVTSPGIWIFLVATVIFPYGIDIVKAILQFAGK